MAAEALKIIAQLIQSLWANRIVFIVFVVGSSYALLLLPQTVIDFFDRQGLLVSNIQYAGPAAFFGTFLGIAELLSLGLSRFHERRRSRQEKRKQVTLLYNITQAECRVLRNYIHPNDKVPTKTAYLPRAHGVVNGLVRMGVLYFADDDSVGRKMSPHFNMEDWAYNYLIAHPELLGKCSSSNPDPPNVVKF